MAHTYNYPRPALTVDCLILHQENDDFQILLIQRKNEPFKNHWALPGGFVDENETVENAALRELKEETNVENIEANLVGVFSEKGRDPRGWTVSVAFYGIVDKSKYQAQAGDDARNIAWFSVKELPDLAFDHDKIIAKTQEKIIP